MKIGQSKIAEVFDYLNDSSVMEIELPDANEVVELDIKEVVKILPGIVLGKGHNFGDGSSYDLKLSDYRITKEHGKRIAKALATAKVLRWRKG